MSQAVDPIQMWLTWLSGILLGAIVFDQSGSAGLGFLCSSVLLVALGHSILLKWRANRSTA